MSSNHERTLTDRAGGDKNNAGGSTGNPGSRTGGDDTDNAGSAGNPGSMRDANNHGANAHGASLHQGWQERQRASFAETFSVDGDTRQPSKEQVLLEWNESMLAKDAAWKEYMRTHKPSREQVLLEWKERRQAFSQQTNGLRSDGSARDGSNRGATRKNAPSSASVVSSAANTNNTARITNTNNTARITNTNTTTRAAAITNTNTPPTRAAGNTNTTRAAANTNNTARAAANTNTASRAAANTNTASRAAANTNTARAAANTNIARAAANTNTARAAANTTVGGPRGPVPAGRRPVGGPAGGPPKALGPTPPTVAPPMPPSRIVAMEALGPTPPAAAPPRRVLAMASQKVEGNAAQREADAALQRDLAATALHRGHALLPTTANAHEYHESHHVSLGRVLAAKQRPVAKQQQQQRVPPPQEEGEQDPPSLRAVRTFAGGTSVKMGLNLVGAFKLARPTLEASAALLTRTGMPAVSELDMAKLEANVRPLVEQEVPLVIINPMELSPEARAWVIQCLAEEHAATVRQLRSLANQFHPLDDADGAAQWGALQADAARLRAETNNRRLPLTAVAEASVKARLRGVDAARLRLRLLAEQVARAALRQPLPPLPQPAALTQAESLFVEGQVAEHRLQWDAILRGAGRALQRLQQRKAAVPEWYTEDFEAAWTEAHSEDVLRIMRATVLSRACDTAAAGLKGGTQQERAALLLQVRKLLAPALRNAVTTKDVEGLSTRVTAADHVRQWAMALKNVEAVASRTQPPTFTRVPTFQGKEDLAMLDALRLTATLFVQACWARHRKGLPFTVAVGEGRALFTPEDSDAVDQHEKLQAMQQAAYAAEEPLVRLVWDLLVARELQGLRHKLRAEGGAPLREPTEQEAALLARLDSAWQRDDALAAAEEPAPLLALLPPWQSALDGAAAFWAQPDVKAWLEADGGRPRSMTFTLEKEKGQTGGSGRHTRRRRRGHAAP